MPSPDTETLDPFATRFALEREVAAGGMGRIFRARDLTTDELVAVKLVSEHDPASLARFERECEALARIAHPNVVRYVAHGHTRAGEPWLAMEWLAGHDLARALDRMRAPRLEPTVSLGPAAAAGRADAAPADEAAPMMGVDGVVALGRCVASALAALHAAGVVHRDLKPGNVFLVDGDLARAKLIDLGIARVDAATGVTQTGTLIGTPYYMAPEQARGETSLGPAVDVFALGAVLYECLAGSSPFYAERVASALVRILMFEPTPIATRRPDVPDQLGAAIGAMLQKALAARPADGAAALAWLERVPRAGGRGSDIAPTAEAASRALAPGPGGRGFHSDPTRLITHAERRSLCTLLVREPAPSPSSAPLEARVSAWLEPTGARASPLLDGSVVVVAEGPATPSEVAARLARVGLALSSRAPALALSLHLEHSADATPTTARRAAELAMAAGELCADAGAAALIESRFELAPIEGGARVVRERPLEAVRTLLGKPTKTVGRKRDLALLEATLEEVQDEGVARAVLVLAPAGVGKTRLVHELLRAPRDAEVLIGRGEPLSAGTPYALIGSALRRAAAIASGDPPEARARVADLLSKSMGPAASAAHAPLMSVLAGVAPDDAVDERMRALRADPSLFAEAAREAFCAWLASLSRPVILVLEDVHWGDLASLRVVDAALGALAERPLFVLALARPEVKTRFPTPFPGKAITEHTLEALPARASAELVRQCLPDAPDEVVDALVARAHGHAFYLEELIRAVAAGEAVHTALPDSVRAMVQARLDAVSVEARRVLRAASLFGATFAAAGVEHLVGGAAAVEGDVARWLGELAAREMIAPAGAGVYAFRHALVRDAAYASFTDDDRAVGHRRAGAWLESIGARDALALALHFREGGDAERAVRWLARAAEEAYEGNDLEGAVRHADEAEAVAAGGGAVLEELGRALGVRATAHLWATAYERSIADGLRALDLLVPGEARWFNVAGQIVIAAARRSDEAALRGIAARATAIAPLDAEAENERLLFLTRVAFQMLGAYGRYPEADEVLAQLPPLDAIEDDPRIDARVKAQLFDVRGVHATWLGEFAAELELIARALEWYQRVGDVRNTITQHTLIGQVRAEIGDPGSITILRDSLARAQAIKAPAAVAFTKMILANALATCGRDADLAEAEQIARETVAEASAAGNRRLEAWSRAHLAECLHRKGDHAGAAAELTIAEAAFAKINALLQTWVVAALARANHALEAAGAPVSDDPLALARRAMESLRRLGGIIQGERLVPLTLVRCLRARGLDAEADDVAREAIVRVLRRADTLPADLRAHFLAHPWTRDTLALLPPGA